MNTLKAKQFHLIEDMDIAAMTFALVERVEALTAKAGNVVQTWVRRSNDRRTLIMMSEHMLEDIGLTRNDVAREVEKHFWQK